MNNSAGAIDGIPQLVHKRRVNHSKTLEAIKANLAAKIVERAPIHDPFPPIPELERMDSASPMRWWHDVSTENRRRLDAWHAEVEKWKARNGDVDEWLRANYGGRTA